MRAWSAVFRGKYLSLEISEIVFWGGEGVTVADHSLFSVSGGFTQVNLQATWDGSAWTRAFAANQYDFIGNLDIIVLFFFSQRQKRR